MPRVCVIDDDSASRKALMLMFQNLNGFEVCEQNAIGDPAVERVGCYPPSLVILGLPLNRDSLAQFVNNMKKVAPDAPIFLLVQNCNSAIEKLALSVGVTAVFSKFDDYEGLILNAEALLAESYQPTPGHSHSEKYHSG